MTGPVLIFGAAGQLGRELATAAADSGSVVVALGRGEADITHAAAVSAAIKGHRPRLVVNAAAYTAVDRAEAEPERADAVNRIGAGIVARACGESAVPLVHVSSDFVFDGQKSRAYVEIDPVNPLSVYGRSKAEGESAVRSETDGHVILRTSWVYGVHGRNFLKTMLRAATERDRLRVVADQRGCPTATQDLAAAILAIDRAIQDGRPYWGTFHLAGAGATTWHGFASRIIDIQAAYSGRRPVVEAIATSDWPTAARRPPNSQLDSARFAEAYGFRAAPWPDRAREVVAALMDRRVVKTAAIERRESMA